jgi:SAM-dependent methyltransferase
MNVRNAIEPATNTAALRTLSSNGDARLESRVMAFADHFSQQANAYAAFRPSYPDALGVYLASLAPSTRRSPTQVWDCATGSGQAATMLARHFDRVVATDASAAQIAMADRCERVEYRVAPAEASGLPHHSCDLITVAQAAHWLDLPAFYTEARRVLKPAGVIALWCYALLTVEQPDVDASVRHLTYERLAGYWPAGRELVEDHYRSLDFPFATITAPPFEMQARWSRADLLGFLGTWSAVARCREIEGQDPLGAFAADLTRVWPDSSTTLEVKWPLYMRVGRRP